MKPGTLGHALAVILVPGDPRDRDDVLDHVNSMAANGYAQLLNQPLTRDLMLEDQFLDALLHYADNDPKLAGATQRMIVQTVGILETATYTDEDTTTETRHYAGIQLLNIRETISGHYNDQDWLLYPLLPRGRQISLYAAGKTGKSLLMLDLSCRIAVEGVNVLYLDFEMTPGDLKERLVTLGYTLDSPKLAKLERHLHYAQLQPFAPFDTREGGEQLEELVNATRSELVTIDTLIRSVEGEENSSDTIKAFYRNTGQRLKALGVTTCRADHAGKDTSRGQRGTSAKRDDVDVVWHLEQGKRPGELVITCDAARMAWIPQKVVAVRGEDEDGYLRHDLMVEIDAGHTPGPGQPVWNETNTRFWQWLTEQPDRYLHTSANQALTDYRNTGHTAKRRHFLEVHSYLKEHYGDGQTAPTRPVENSQNGGGNHQGTTSQGTTTGTTREPAGTGDENLF